MTWKTFDLLVKELTNIPVKVEKILKETNPILLFIFNFLNAKTELFHVKL